MESQTTREERAKIAFKEANYSAKNLIHRNTTKKGFKDNTNNQKRKRKDDGGIIKQSNQMLDEGVNASNNGLVYTAIQLHAEAIQRNPNNFKAKRNLSVLLKRLGNLREAEYFVRECLSEQPHNGDCWNTLGTILSDQAKFEEAGKAYQKSLSINPDNASANSNLAGIYHALGQIDPSFLYSRRAVCINANSSELWLDHLTQVRRVCDFDTYEKIDWWKIAAKAEFNSLGPAFLQLLAGTSGADDQIELLKLQKKWASEAEKRAINNNQHRETQSINPSIRIGMISSDFKDHSVARFIWPIFKHLDRTRFSLYCYSIEKTNDKWQRRFKENATGFREVQQFSNSELISQIRDDRIEFLFDLTGFTHGSRTSLFANRVAEHQITWLGFPGSTGLKNMDYLFADQYLTPANEDLISEKIMLTEGSSVCFSGIEEIPITKRIPEEVRGFVTFGTLNNPYKFTREMISTWANIMIEIKSSKMLFVRREFSSYHLRQNIIDVFEKHGIDRNRILFFNNREAGRHYLDCYNEIDMTLDTYPVTGGTTTADSLWMGVPVITKVGDNVHQRVSSAILNHAGRKQWIACDESSYIKKAIDLARDREERQKCRLQLREQIKKSLLCDEELFVEHFCNSILKIKQKKNKL